MKRKLILCIWLSAIILALATCGGVEQEYSENPLGSRSGSIPFQLPSQEDFEEHLFASGVQAWNDNYVIEIGTYDITICESFDNRPTIIFIVDVDSASIGRGGFFDWDRLHMLSESYVLAAQIWLQQQAREQALDQNAISATMDAPFIVAVVGVDGIGIGSSAFDNETNTVIWTEY